MLWTVTLPEQLCVSILSPAFNFTFEFLLSPRDFARIRRYLRSLYQTSMSAFNTPLVLSAIPLPLLVLAGAVLFLLLKYRDGRAIGTDKRDDVRTIRGIPLIGLLPFF